MSTLDMPVLRQAPQDKEAVVRRAWAILWVCFFIFCILLGTSFWGARAYANNASVPQQGNTVQPLDEDFYTICQDTNCQFHQGPGSVQEGDTIRPQDPAGRAWITLWDGSTVELFSNSQVTFTQLRASRYHLSPRKTVVLKLDKGTIRIRMIVDPLQPHFNYQVNTDVAEINLNQEGGSYRINALKDGSTLVQVRQGSATVTAKKVSEVIGSEQQALISPGQLPSPVTTSLQPLISQGVPTGNGRWLRFGCHSNFDCVAINDTTTGEDLGHANPETTNVNGQLTPVWRFLRGTPPTGTDLTTGDAPNEYARSGIHVDLNIDVHDYKKLTLKAWLKVHWQSQSGGGVDGTQYPLTVHLEYTDALGTPQDWYKYYYVQNTDPPNPTTGGEEIQPDVWNNKEFDLFDPQLIGNPPVYIKSLEFYGAGLGYDASVTNISLEAQ